jgi:hypothetical protein
MGYALDADGNRVGDLAPITLPRTREVDADGDPGTPEPQPFSAVAESGRGVVIVSAISAAWGIETQPNGKVTWAELRPE